MASCRNNACCGDMDITRVVRLASETVFISAFAVSTGGSFEAIYNKLLWSTVLWPDLQLDYMSDYSAMGRNIHNAAASDVEVGAQIAEHRV